MTTLDPLHVKPLPAPVPTPAGVEKSQEPFYRYVGEQFARHDEIERERRYDEAERRVVYEAERREQAEQLEQVGKAVAQVAEVCAALTRKLAEVDERVDRIEGLVLGLRARFDTIALTVQSQGDDLHALRDRLDALEAEVAQIKFRLDAYAPTSRSPATDPSACVDPLEPGGES